MRIFLYSGALLLYVLPIFSIVPAIDVSANIDAAIVAGAQLETMLERAMAEEAKLKAVEARLNDLSAIILNNWKREVDDVCALAKPLFTKEELDALRQCRFDDQELISRIMTEKNARSKEHQDRRRFILGKMYDSAQVIKGLPLDSQDLSATTSALCSDGTNGK